MLEADQVLRLPLEVASFTTLDCQGHRLTADAVSPPLAAILLNQVSGATVRNCRIEGFERGILVTNRKLGPAPRHGDPEALLNRLERNIITATVAGIEVLHSDGTIVTDNTVHFSQFGIRAIWASSRNTIAGNRIEQVPGSAAFTAVAVFGYEPEDVVPAVSSLIVGPRLLQFPQEASRSEDNLVAGNAITIYGTLGGILSVTGSLRTVARDNVVRGEAYVGSIATFGFPADTFLRLPGTCKPSSGAAATEVRYCDALFNGDADCNIDGFPLPGGPWSCSGESEVRPWEGRVLDFTIEDNLLTSPGPQLPGSSGLAGFFALNQTMRNNRVEGHFFSGVSLNSYTLETAVVTGNHVSGADFALALADSELATRFSAQIGSNDFVHSVRAGVAAVTQCFSPQDGSFHFCLGYPDPRQEPAFAAELSVGGVGNYWGHTCGSGGFTDADSVVASQDYVVDGNFNILTAGPLHVSPSPHPNLIRDSHPLGAPVGRGEDNDGRQRPCR